MIKGQIPGTPIIYDSQKAGKVIVDSRNDKEQVECQLNGYNSKVGFATNISSSLYCLLEEFQYGTQEYKAISNRLKIGRVIQGEIIDGVKGLKVPPFRNHWVKYKHIKDDMTPEEKAIHSFNNKILCDIRPAFFRFLYPHYLSRYNKEIKKYNLYSYSKFGMSFEDVKSLNNKTPEQIKMINDYKKYSYFLDNESTMNAISHYIKNHTTWVQRFSKKEAQIADYSTLTSGKHELTQFGISKMKEFLQEYKSFRRGKKTDFNNEFDNLDSFISYLHKKCESYISTNESELADYAIEVTYGGEVSMTEFVWKMFPDGILENIISNSSGAIEVLVKDENGSEEYLWTRYSKKKISLEEIYGELENGNNSNVSN